MAPEGRWGLGVPACGKRSPSGVGGQRCRAERHALRPKRAPAAAKPDTTDAPHTPHTRPTQAIASALTPKFYSISTLPFSFLFLDTNRTTSFSFVLKQPPPRLFERCEHERHVYELCQYKDYKKRVKAAEDAK